MREIQRGVRSDAQWRGCSAFRKQSKLSFEKLNGRKIHSTEQKLHHFGEKD